MGRLLRETGEGTIKTNTHHTPRVHSDDTDEFVRESVRRFFKSLSTRGVFSLMRNGVVCFMIDMSNDYDTPCFSLINLDFAFGFDSKLRGKHHTYIYDM